MAQIETGKKHVGMKAPREFPKIEEIQNCEFYCDSNCFNKL
jgi:hypothetical protein